MVLTKADYWGSQPKISKPVNSF